MYAVQSGEIECTMAIVNAGADITLRNEKEETAGDFNFFSCLFKNKPKIGMKQVQT